MAKGAFAIFFVEKHPFPITFSFGDKLIIFVNFDKGIEICIGYVYDVISKYLFIIYSKTFFPQ